jgi:ElaB/YqjD/DUF883 family membrane-anchored ribosome-binding protein
VKGAFVNIVNPDVQSFAAPSAPEHAYASASAAAEARDWWRRNAKSALDLAGTVKDEVAVAGDRARLYVRDEPLRSVAFAAAAGAAITALLMLLGRNRRH